MEFCQSEKVGTLLSFQTIVKKNAFQSDAYCPLQWPSVLEEGGVRYALDRHPRQTLTPLHAGLHPTREQKGSHLCFRKKMHHWNILDVSHHV